MILFVYKLLIECINIHIYRAMEAYLVMANKKVVLAYSGGLDTSVAIPWLKEQGWDVIAVCLDVGEGKDLEFVKNKALQVGAIESYMVDAKDEFAENYALTSLQAHTWYEQKYPLVSALSRPLISKKLVEIANQVGADAVAHGCTGKGNDQVRFEVSIKALNPDLEVLAPVREWGWSRDEEIEYAMKHNVPIPATLDSPFSIDQNLWGRANEAGIMEDPWVSPPEEAYGLTVSVENAPNEAEYVEIEFVAGKPVALNGKEMKLADLIQELNAVAGAHGIGRIDHVENRLVGIKSREVYEIPGAKVLLTAHKELEDLTLVKELAHFKPVIEKKLSELIYDGLWFSPLRDALEAFLTQSQQYVNGTVRVKLFKGHAIVEGRKSPNSLYNEKLATYSKEDQFNHASAVGFIELWGLPTVVNSAVNKK